MSLTRSADVPDGTRLDTGICIVGGGPIGITVALQLEGAGIDVTVLESGGSDGETAEHRALNEGAVVGLPYYDLTETRMRGLGGASNLWAGWCRPIDRIDLERRDWFPTTGWPISYDELEPFLIEAARLCELDGIMADVPPDRLPPMYRPPFVGGDVEVALWQGSPPTKFWDVYGGRLRRSRNVAVYTDATATEILTAPDGGAVTGVRVAGPDGRTFVVRAGTVVLAAGAIETARLLLASNAARPAGLGNEYDLVGRHFMEHPHLVTARLRVLAPTGRATLPAVDRGLTGARARLAMQRPAGGVKVAYVVAEGRKRAEHLLNFSTHLRTVSPVSREDSDAYEAFKLLVTNLRSPGETWRQVRSGAVPEGLGRLLGRIVRGLPDVFQIVYHEALRRPRRLALYTQSEQVPNPDSRVTVDPRDRDRHGVPRVRLQWRLSRLDKETVIRSQAIVGERLQEAGLGVLEPEPAFRDDGPDWGPNLRGGHHHMGTARMATDPRHGVVDPDGKVHSVEGLFVGDAAVFPTGGYANPMQTSVAFAVRLGRHLRRHVT